MGRRATSTTKGGRYMNPADQERKVERRRELKKNKRQRVAVRQAVLKSKDPKQLIEEMRKLDSLEFNPHEPPPISERVIQDKRNKMRETYVRVMSMVRQESQQDKYLEMKRDLNDYDRLRSQVEQHYIAVKFTREVDPGEIPLPTDAAPLPLMPPPLMGPPVGPPMGAPPPFLLTASGLAVPFPTHLMLPPNAIGPQFPAARAPLHSILKKKSKATTSPGVPAGAPPDLSDDEPESGEEEAIDNEAEEGERAGSGSEDETNVPGKKKAIKVRFGGADQASEDKDTRTKYKLIAKKIASGEKVVSSDNKDDATTEAKQSAATAGLTPQTIGPLMRHMAPMPPRGMQPPLPPGLNFGPRMPPPGGMRLLPPPAFIRPGTFQRPSFIGPNVPSAGAANTTGDSSVISSGPVLVAPPSVNKPAKPAGPIIEAKPQLRNMQHEVTKFVPTGVKIKMERGGASVAATATKEGPSGAAAKSKGPIVFRVQPSNAAQAAQRAKAKTTDDAYDDFMKEMKDLL